MSESVRVLIRPMVFVASTLLGGLAFAAPVAQIVPYAGNLDRDGVPLDGTRAHEVARSAVAASLPSRSRRFRIAGRYVA